MLYRVSAQSSAIVGLVLIMTARNLSTRTRQSVHEFSD